MMGKFIKRSKGVIILAILLFLAHIDFNPKSFEYYDSYFGNLAGFFVLLTLVYNMLGIVIAAGLLFLKDIIRKVVIIFHILYIPDVILRSLISYPLITKNFAGEAVTTHHFATTFATVFTIGICTLYIYFFTRPKVKEKFS